MSRLILIGLCIFGLSRSPSAAAQEPAKFLSGKDAVKANELASQYRAAEAAEDYDEALRLQRELLELRTKVLGANHWDTVTQRWNADQVRKVAALSPEQRVAWKKSKDRLAAAQQLVSQGQAAQAEPLLREYIQTCREVLGEMHLGTASSYSRLAYNLNVQGRPAEAQQVYQKVLDLRLKLVGDKHPHTATNYANLAKILARQRKYAEARVFFQKALDVRLEIFGTHLPQTATSYLDLADNLFVQGKYADALPLYEQALDIRLKLLGEKHADTAQIYNYLALNLHQLADFTRAEQCFQKALDISLELGRQKHSFTAAVYGNLAITLTAQGKYTQAQPLYEKVLDLDLELYGEKHISTAKACNNLALNLYRQGEYARAQPLFQRALDLKLELLGEKHPSTALSYNNLALNLNGQGNYAQAQVLYQKALDLRLELLGKEHPLTAQSYNNLAAALNEKGEYAEAEPLCRQALDLYIQLLGEKHPDTAQYYNNLALVLQAQGKYAEALPLGRKALEIHLELLGEKHIRTAVSYAGLALNLEAQGKYAEAQAYRQKPLEIHLELFGEKHPYTVRSYTNMATFLAAQGKYDEARERAVQAAASYEAARLSAATGGMDRAVFGAGMSPYKLLSAVEANLQSPAAAWLAAETDLARGLSDEIASRHGRTLTDGERKRKAELSAQWSKLQPRILQLVSNQSTSDAKKEELSRLQSQRAAAENELAELAVIVSQREIASLATVQSAIPANAALVLWADATDRQGSLQEHWGCVVRRTGNPIWQRLPGGEAEDEWTDHDSALPGKLRAALASTSSTAAEVHALAEAVGGQRFAPLTQYLDGVNTLYVVAVNRMAGIPVELLTDKYTISYVPSGTFLARLKGKSPPTGSALLALGDPVFDGPDERSGDSKQLPPGGLLVTMVAPNSTASAARLQPGDVLLSYAGVALTSVEKLNEVIRAEAEVKKEVPMVIWREGVNIARTLPPGRLGVALDKEPAPQAIANRRKTEAMLSALRGGQWEELPGTRVELTQIAGLFGTRARTLLDSAASEQSLDEIRKSGELSRYRYLHFATHGEANNVRALESVLILSQDKLPKTPLPRAGEPFIDGRLSANEVLEFWNLNAELVTLSACETALGRAGGGDGLLGFAQAFLTSGSRAVCLSLWNVDDTATSLLMARFYQNLLGKRPDLDEPMPKASALAEAKRWLRELSAKEALKLTAAATSGVLRDSHNRGLKLVVPSADPVKPATSGTKPFAHPRYWSAFILIGDPN